MSKPIHVALSEDDFAGLVRGEIITTIGNGQIVKIILSDIGWHRMLDAILEARLSLATNPYRRGEV